MKEKTHGTRYAGIAVCVLLYLAAYLIAGYRLHNDSGQYIAMHIRREPVYPLYLALLRALFGAERSLWWAGLIQCLINAVCTYFFAEKMTALLHGSSFLKIAAYVLALIPQPMTYFFSRTHLFLAGDIQSESLAYPLFLVTVPCLLQLLTTDKEERTSVIVKRAVLSFVLIFVNSLIRAQMLVLIVLWLLAMIVCLWKMYRGNGKRLFASLLLAFVCTGLFFCGRTLFTRAYFAALGEGFETYAVTKGYALSHFFYVAGEQDAAYVPEHKVYEDAPDYTLRDYFSMMYDKMDALGLGRRFETGTFFERVAFMEECNDPIKFDVIERTMYETLRPEGYDYNEENLREITAYDGLLSALAPALFTRWLTVYLRHVFMGLVRSIGVAAHLIWIPFIALEFFALVWTVRGFVRALRKKNKVPAAVWCMALALLYMTGNAMMVSLVHFCISRYMFYAFPVFYLALLALMTDVRKKDAA